MALPCPLEYIDVSQTLFELVLQVPFKVKWYYLQDQLR
ncbi:hypothetical protein NIES22_12040 [Calothrix brevissima NIES-22]|nr:hypothetical protein NIES22_12040 [Calothrix brevissima NIES-22]